MKKKIMLSILFCMVLLFFTGCRMINKNTTIAYSGFGIDISLSKDKESYSASIWGNNAVFPAEYNGKPIDTISKCSPEVSQIKIPDTIIKIESEAFKGCRDLKNISLPFSIQSIGDRVFSDCDNLESVTIPCTLVDISSNTFSYCKKLSTVTYMGTFIEYCESSLTGMDFFSSYDSSLTHHFVLSIDEKKNEIIQMEIPHSVTSIGGYKFYGFNNVKSVILHKSITSIDKTAFQNCSNIKDVYYEGTEEEFNKKFADCFNRNITFHSIIN